MSPPASEPTTPSPRVRRALAGSRPGQNDRAAAPTSRPVSANTTRFHTMFSSSPGGDNRVSVLASLCSHRTRLPHAAEPAEVRRHARQEALLPPIPQPELPARLLHQGRKRRVMDVTDAGEQVVL